MLVEVKVQSSARAMITRYLTNGPDCGEMNSNIKLLLYHTFLDRGMNLGRFGLFNKLTAREGKRDELAKILLQASKSMEELDDCDLYVVSLGNESSDSIYVYEVWVDENAHQASLSQEVFQSLIQKAKLIIAGMEKVNTLSPLGGKGISTFPRD